MTLDKFSSLIQSAGVLYSLALVAAVFLIRVAYVNAKASVRRSVDAEIAALANERAAIIAEIDKLQERRNRELHDELISTTARVAALSLRITALETENTALRTDNGVMTSRLAGYELRITELETELTSRNIPVPAKAIKK